MSKRPEHQAPPEIVSINNLLQHYQFHKNHLLKQLFIHSSTMKMKLENTHRSKFLLVLFK